MIRVTVEFSIRRVGYDDIFETADSDMQDAYYLHSFYDQSRKAVLIP